MRAPASGDASPLDARLCDALARASAGEDLDRDAALALLADPSSTEALLAAAAARRDRAWGRTVTYSPKVFLPVTNLCRDRCDYCTFRKDPDDPDAWTMRPEEIRTWAARGRALGCREALLCLGDRPETAFPSYRALLARLGHRTTAEYLYEAATIALDAGLLPHTNAGVLTREEGELRIPFTTGLLLGIGETLAERVETLLAIRDLHRTYGHIQEVIVQAFRAKPTIPRADAPEPGALDVARTVALARLVLDPEVSVQAPPNLSPDDHALLLAAGLNDWGGISPLTPDYVNPEAPWPHVRALAATCAAAGFVLAERLPIYPAFVARPGFLAPGLRARVAACAPAAEAHP